MLRLKVHYEGWVALPEAFRRKLGLERGDEIDAELVDGTIVLRPFKGSAKAMTEEVSSEAAAATPAPSILAAGAQETEEPVIEPEAAPPPKRRGRASKGKR